MPRRAAEEVKAVILRVINTTPMGSFRQMSTNEMSRILKEDYGLSEKDSKKVSTQIRKSGPLHRAWKDAFATGRFAQKNGRPPRDLDNLEFPPGSAQQAVSSAGSLPSGAPHYSYASGGEPMAKRIRPNSEVAHSQSASPMMGPMMAGPMAGPMAVRLGGGMVGPAAGRLSAGPGP